MVLKTVNLKKVCFIVLHETMLYRQAIFVYSEIEKQLKAGAIIFNKFLSQTFSIVIVLLFVARFINLLNND